MEGLLGGAAATYRSKEEMKLLDGDPWAWDSASDSDDQELFSRPSTTVASQPDLDSIDSVRAGARDPGLGRGNDQSALLPAATDTAVTVFKIFKTVSLVYVWIVMGLFSTIVNSTLLSLRLRTDADMEQIGRAVSVKFGGICLGSICGGLLSDRMRNRTDLITAVALTLASVAITLKPWVSSLLLLEFLFVLEGVAHGCMNAAGNSMCLMIWGPSASSPLHAMHFGFGVGMTLAPLIAGPFLPNKYVSSSVLGNNSSMNASSVTGSTISSRSIIVHDTSTIEYPYLIIGIFTLLAAIIFYVFTCAGTPRGFTLHGCTKKSFKEVLHPSSCGGHTAFTVQLLVVFCLFYFFLIGHEYSLRPYLFSYAVNGDLHLPNHRAAYLDASYSFAFTCGRGISIIAAYFCRIQILLFGEVFLLAAFSMCLAIFGVQTELLLWITACAVAVVSAPIYPGGLAWADRYIAVSAIVVSLVDVLGGLAGMFASWLTGYIFEYNTTRSPLYVALVASLGLCLVLVAMQVIASTHGDRHSHNTKKDNKYMKLEDMNHE